MKKSLLLAMLVGVFSLSLTTTSCGEEEEVETPTEDQFAEFRNLKGNVSGVNIHVVETKTDTYEILDENAVGDLSEDEIADLIKSGNAPTIKEEYSYSDNVQGAIVYMYNLDDWDKYGASISKDSCVDRQITDEQGVAHFEFGEELFDEGLLTDYVFVACSLDKQNSSSPSAISLKLGKLAEATVYTSGEKSTGAKYSNLFKTYAVQHVESDGQLTLPWLRDNASSWFSISIPEKTVSWYVQITCSAATERSGLAIAADLANILDKRVGLVMSAVDKIATPDGTEACDFYVFDEDNFKKWQNGNSASSISVHKGYKSGIYQNYTDIEPGKYYLVFHNPNWSKVYVNYDLAIQVEE
jgi:hypothetical protein